MSPTNCPEKVRSLFEVGVARRRFVAGAAAAEHDVHRQRHAELDPLEEAERRLHLRRDQTSLTREARCRCRPCRLSDVVRPACRRGRSRSRGGRGSATR